MKNTRRNLHRPEQKLFPVDQKDISRRRLQCIEQIEQMRSYTGPSTSFAARAHSLLLPRYWQEATWRRRAEILASVEWLLRLGEKAASFDKA